MPPAWAREDSVNGISAYEALQPPLYYWLMAPILYILKNASLLTQVMVLRWAGVLIASFAVPITFAIGSAVARSDSFALGCAAVVAVMPGFAGNAARVSNEPLSILLFSLLILTGLQIVARGATARGAVVLGALLGLGLLTKAYFLTAVPAVVLLLLFQLRTAWQPALITSAVTAAVGGWWYIHNAVTTGALSGLAESVTLHDRGFRSLLTAIPRIPWGHALDVILVSHIYFSGWSSLTVRSWMYRVFFAFLIMAAIGLISRARQPDVLWLLSIYGFFWVGQFYNVVLQYLTKGLAGSMGWYLYAVVGCEVVLCAIAFGRFRVWAAATGTFLFGVLDLYGMHWLAVPYYTGLVAHKANGAPGVLHLSDFQSIGFAGVFDRLAENKAALLSQPVLILLWIFYLAATLAPMIVGIVIWRRRSPVY
jgi:hypothetical protein